MNRALEKKSKIVLTSAGRTTEFLIDEVLGVGGSCIAYEVSYKEREEVFHRGVLKEFCPSYLVDLEDFKRENANLIIPEIQRVEFEVGLRNFKDTYKTINKYLVENVEATNYHPVQLGLFEGNNTAYTLVSKDYGKSYDKMSDGDLVSLLELMLSVTKAVGHYHAAGFLHLDIKPKNILVLDGVTDIVKLFDFDSILAIDRLKDEGIVVPKPETYYVPELESGNVRAIGTHTDIFEIGSMLFLRLFGREPHTSEMNHDSEFKFIDAPLLEDASPTILCELETLFKHTIQIARRKRYQNIEELQVQLHKLISLASEETPYLMDMPKWYPSSRSVGRNEELREISKRLEQDGYVFVKGIGGVGKSEIAKLYAMKYAEKYHTVQFCKYNDSLQMLTASLAINGIEEKNYKNFEEVVQEKNRILHMSDARTLIVVDNFNTIHDDFLRDFLPKDSTQFKVIFTTRCTMAADYYADKTYFLPPLSEKECEELFGLYCMVEDKLENKQYIRKIINMIESNTLVLILLAKAIHKTGISLQNVVEKLESQELEELDIDLFHEYDYGNAEIKTYNKLYAHLSTVFSVSKLKKIEREIIKNMTLISSRGMSIEEFSRFCQRENVYPQGVVQDLIAQGWIEIDDRKMLTMHPVISDMIAGNANILKEESYYRLAQSLEEYCEPDYSSHISVLESKLFAAIQLEKRYKKETANKRILIKIKLGRMYMNVYQPTQANKYLLEAEELAEKHRQFAYQPFIDFFRGLLERQFGIQSQAIKCYKKAIWESVKVKTWYYRTRLVIESLMEIAYIYLSNDEFQRAFKEYKKCLMYARNHLLFGYIYEIADMLISICEQLGWEEKEKKYKRIKYRYEKYAADEDKASNERDTISEHIKNGDIIKGLDTLEKMLDKKRKELGEDSPIYQDVAQDEWITYIIKGDKQRAIRLATERLRFCEQTYGKNSMMLAEALALVALLVSEQMEFEFAMESANRAIAICEKNQKKDTYIFFQAKIALAKIHSVRGEVCRAHEVIKDIDFHKFIANEQLADIVKNVGLLLVDLSEYEVAQQISQRLLSRKNIPVYDKFWALIILGNVKLNKGMLKDAKEHLIDAREYLEQLKDFPRKREMMLAYYRLNGQIAFQEGNYKLAIEQINLLMDLFEEDEQKSFLLSGAIMERGLYYTSDGQTSLAKKDYQVCEEILRKEGVSQESFQVLYNNIALNYAGISDYENAQIYLDKIVQTNESVLCPKSHFDALVCNNIGWVALNLNDLEKAEKMIKKALLALEKIGVNRTRDYLATKHNLALTYCELKKREESIRLYREIHEEFDACVSDINGELRIQICMELSRLLLESEKNQEAYDYAMEEKEKFVLLFGKGSLQYIDLLLELGSLFLEYGFWECLQFFESAEQVIEEGNYYNTVYAARLLNFLGVCESDLFEDMEEALQYFESAKELFERLEETEEIYYQAVLHNIEYVKSSQ